MAGARRKTLAASPSKAASELPPSDRESAANSFILEADRRARGEQPSSPHFARLISDNQIRLQACRERFQRFRESLREKRQHCVSTGGTKKKRGIKNKRTIDLPKPAADVSTRSLKQCTGGTTKKMGIKKKRVIDLPKPATDTGGIGKRRVINLRKLASAVKVTRFPVVGGATPDVTIAFHGHLGRRMNFLYVK